MARSYFRLHKCIQLLSPALDDQIFVNYYRHTLNLVHEFAANVWLRTAGEIFTTNLPVMLLRSCQAEQKERPGKEKE